MLSEVIMQGRMTKDPETRRTQSGKACTSFSLACERDFKNQDGTRTTDFVDCVAWGNTAEFISRNFTKGSMAYVKGRLIQNRFTTRSGESRSTLEINVENIYFGSSPKSSQNANNGPQNEFYDLPDDSELPFMG